MAARTSGRPYKDYVSGSALNLLGFIFLRSTSPLEDIDKLSEPQVLSGNSTCIPDTFFITSSIVKYIEKDL